MLKNILKTFNSSKKKLTYRFYCSKPKREAQNDQLDIIQINGKSYQRDEWTNVTPKILSYLNKNIYLTDHHPLSLIRQKIVSYFHSHYTNRRGNPIFSIYEHESPVVTTFQNFDSLLIPESHPSRAKSDCYYINKDYLLRAHTTAHQAELMQSGLDSFIIIGDVYRRDEIDATHFPVFHQVDGVHLKTTEELFKQNQGLKIFEPKLYNPGSIQENDKQICHTMEAAKLMEHHLKESLIGLARNLFGDKIQHRWVDTFFPFTQPSWELEIFYNNQWLEVLGCGIIQNAILEKAGIKDRIGWAFGLGLERLAMCLYQIPDIRLFWSQDSGFLNQFKSSSSNRKIIYKPVSVYPQCSNDISFWLPVSNSFSSNDFYDLVRSTGGDIIEQVVLKDVFKHPKTGKISHCYQIVYRHMERTLTQEEVNKIHKLIESTASNQLAVKIR